MKVLTHEIPTTLKFCTLDIKDLDLVFWYFQIQDGGRHPIYLINAMKMTFLC